MNPGVPSLALAAVGQVEGRYGWADWPSEEAIPTREGDAVGADVVALEWSIEMAALLNFVSEKALALGRQF